MKTCRRCGLDMPRSNFYADKRLQDGLRNDCKDCHRGYPSGKQSKERAAKYRRRHPDRVRRSNRRQLLREYGLTLEEFEARSVAQGGACTICGEVPPQLCVDHDHTDGHVRGLLCANCNGGIGKLRDDPEILRAALHYLEADTAAL